MTELAPTPEYRPLESEPLFRPRVFPIRATYILLAANTAVFILTSVLAALESPDTWQGLRLWLTGMVQSPEQAAFFQRLLLSFGAAYGPYLEQGEYFRLVMPMFLHIGLLHLLVNSFALYLLGRILERVYGYGRYMLLYVGAGVASSALSMTIAPHVSAGASGSIFGIAGGLLVVGLRHPQSVPLGLRRAFGRGILPFILINLFLGWMLPMVDNWGHLGGLIGGALVAYWVQPPAAGEPTGGPLAEEPSQGIVLIPLLIVALGVSGEVRHFLGIRHSGEVLERADTLLGRGQFDKALEELEPLAQKQPHDERIRVQQAVAHLGLGQLDEAQELLDGALETNPDSLFARVALAAVHRKRGDSDSAERQYRILAGQEAEKGDVRRFFADIGFQIKLHEEAIEQYRRALILNENDALAHNNLAWLYATAEDPDFRRPQAALEHATLAVELTRWQEATLIDTLAEALYVNGRHREAIETQQRALQLEPGNQTFQDHMTRYRQALTERRL
ncbi:MAG: rhomboid family intramembrane serine protease [Acidobacteria bacterium]|nr:rhomboid family intramembrane serine protease [Acidobacteriota bacterium]